MRALDIKKLSVQYHTERGVYRALRDMDLYVEEREITGIVGESGSGKTTAMLAVMGLLDKNSTVRSEKVTVCGEPPMPGVNIAMVFQDPQSCLNPTVKIGRQITETIRTRRHCGWREARERAEELLGMVGISDGKKRMRQYPFELSGGMRQRVVIAIALACEPKLIIADEPTTALDAAVQAQILRLLKKIVEETGTALLLVSHDLGVTASLCQRVYVMHEGKIVESGIVEDVFYDPQDGYTRQLLSSAKQKRKNCGSPEDQVLFRMEHVTKEYNTRDGIRDISLDLRRGEVFALAGESGSGKTTLARVLTGILKEDGGVLYYKEQPLDQKQRDRSRNKVQMVFQDPYASLNPCLTVEQALEEALRGADSRDGSQRRRMGTVPARDNAAEKQSPSARRRDRKAEREARRKTICDMLKRVGLTEEYMEKYPSELSGGQRQRIGIARALIVRPELLICDEALSSLDAVTQEQILDLLLDIQKEQGIACLFISHDMHVIRRISSRMGVMYGGRLVESGRTKEICSDPWHPYTKQLLEAVPEADPLRARRIRSLPLGKRTADKVQTGKGCPFAGECGYAMACCTEQEPETYTFGERAVSCFLYAEKYSGRRDRDYIMTSQI